MCNIEVSVHIYGITGLVKISKTMKYFVDFIGGKKENLTEKITIQNARFKPAPDFYVTLNFLWNFESEGNFLLKEAQGAKQNNAPPEDVRILIVRISSCHGKRDFANMVKLRTLRQREIFSGLYECCYSHRYLQAETWSAGVKGV